MLVAPTVRQQRIASEIRLLREHAGLSIPDAAAVGQTLAAPTEVRGLHVAGPAGWCLGCLTGWNRLVLIEQCTQLQWANTVYTPDDQANQTETGGPHASATRPAVMDGCG
jgi:hypothetical protein